jgi:hypothetical protein
MILGYPAVKDYFPEYLITFDYRTRYDESPQWIWGHRVTREQTMPIAGLQDTVRWESSVNLGPPRNTWTNDANCWIDTINTQLHADEWSPATIIIKHRHVIHCNHDFLLPRKILKMGIAVIRFFKMNNKIPLFVAATIGFSILTVLVFYGKR